MRGGRARDGHVSLCLQRFRWASVAKERDKKTANPGTCLVEIDSTGKKGRKMRTMGQHAILTT